MTFTFVKIVLSFRDQRLDIYYLQFIEIYLGSCYLYSFDWQKAFEAKYIAKNLWASREYGKHQENDIEHGSNTITKS